MRIYVYSPDPRRPEITVQCRECGARTQNGRTAQEATNNWNEQKYMPVFSYPPVTAAEMSTEGAVNLLEAILEETGREYRELLQKIKKKKYGTAEYNFISGMIEQCERYMRKSSFVAMTGLDADLIIQQIRREEK